MRAPWGRSFGSRGRGKLGAMAKRKPQIAWVDPPEKHASRGMNRTDVEELLDAVEEGDGQWAIVATFSASSGASTRWKRMVELVGVDEAGQKRLAQFKHVGGSMDAATKSSAGGVAEHGYALWLRFASTD